MRERYLLSAVCFSLTLLLFSCFSTVVKYPYTLNENYRSVNLSDRKLVVAFPGDNHIIINNKDDIADDFGGVNAKPESRIRKYYFQEFYSTVKSLVSGDSIFIADQCRPGLQWDTISKNDITLKTGGDSMPVLYSVPAKSRMSIEGLDSTVVIIVDRIEFKRNNLKIEYYWDDRSRKPANLEVTVKVVIWDYKNDVPIFYGILTEQTVFHFGLQRKHWDESAHDLAKKIVLAAKCL
jgi:hypothetical protein